MEKLWFEEWFNLDYLNLYHTRDKEEAKRQVAFIIDALSLKGDETILDLGCGEGRHLRVFESLGYKCVGIDFSKTLIEKARRESKSIFYQEDLYDANLGQFDVCLNLFTSFGYFSSDEKNATFFDVVRRHLKEGGKCFLDTLHPFQVKRDLISHQELIIKGELVVIDKKISNDQVIKTIQFPGRSYVEKVKLYSRETIESMAKKSGLQLIRVYNDYQGNPWKKNGNRQLFVFKYTKVNSKIG